MRCYSCARQWVSECVGASGRKLASGSLDSRHTGNPQALGKGDSNEIVLQMRGAQDAWLTQLVQQPSPAPQFNGLPMAAGGLGGVIPALSPQAATVAQLELSRQAATAAQQSFDLVEQIAVRDSAVAAQLSSQETLQKQYRDLDHKYRQLQTQHSRLQGSVQDIAVTTSDHDRLHDTHHRELSALASRNLSEIAGVKSRRAAERKAYADTQAEVKHCFG